jgi:hypothetical protein
METSNVNATPAGWWFPVLNWETPAGRTLKQLFAALPGGRDWRITVFGSAPLQLTLEPTFTSADVDLFAGDVDASYEELKRSVQITGLEDDGSDKMYVQVCVFGNFRTSPRWWDRAFRTQVGPVQLTLPHPLDILIAKLHRLDEKDLRAFRLVIERTGHPTEEEMKEELQAAVDLYRPAFDEEMIGDITTNTAVLWDELWGKRINVRQEIIAPALALRLEGHRYDIPRRSYKDDLRRLGEE